MAVQPGDSLSLSREGKVFLNQYSSVSAFVSLTRVLGDDPDADIETMREDLDRMFREQLLANLAGINDAYEGMADDGSFTENDPENVVRLIEYLERSTACGPERRTTKKRRKRVTRSS